VSLIAILVAVFALAAHAAEPLASLDYRILGLELRPERARIAMPKGIAGGLGVHLVAGDGSQPAEAREAASGAIVEATLRGPSFPARRLVGLPNGELALPPLPLVGDYSLDEIRLVDATTGAVRMEAKPASVPITVFAEVLVSRVTSRPLSLDEIEERGIAIDESSFRVLEFEVGFVVDGETVPVRFPVVAPQLRQSTEIVPRAEVEALLAEAEALNAEIASGFALPPELEVAQLDFQVRGISFQVVSPGGDDAGLELEVPPVPALMLIPGSIGLLNQFFSVQIFTENAAPIGSALSVYDIDAELFLPRGIDGVGGTHADPGDDPLRFARVGPDEVIEPVQRIAALGPDGQPGTGDDVERLQPGETGQAEFLVEGLEEGLHILDLELRGRLDGVASVPVEIRGKAAGSVLVRNPSFSLAFSHPRTVRAGEPYTASVTVLNTSPAPANLVRVTLPQSALSGASFEPGTTDAVELGTLLPGETATAEWRLRALRTGSITFSQLITDDDIVGRFRLRMGVDERGVALSPDAIGYPEYLGDLESAAPELVAAANRMLGQALSAATAAVLPPGVVAVSKSTVTQRTLALAEAGQRLRYGEPLASVLADLWLDWQGGRSASEGFDQILRETQAGREWREALVAAMEGAEPGADAVDRLADHAADLAGRGEAWWLFASDAAALEPVLASGEAEAALDRSELAGAAGYRGARGHSLLARAVPNAGLRFDVTADTGGFEVAWLELGDAGSGVLRRWPVSGAAAGDCLRLSAAAPDALELDAGCDGSAETSLMADETAVAERPPEVLAAIQDLQVRVGRPPDSCYQNQDRNYATVLAVLFSKPMIQASAGRPEAYALDDGNAATSVRVQPGGRVALLNLSRPIGRIEPEPPASRSLVVDRAADARGNAVVPDPLPIQATASDGVSLSGAVIGTDGQPVPGVPVTLTMNDEEATDDGCKGWTRRISQVRTDAEGRFAFDFVLAGVPYTISATDTRALPPETVDALVEASAGGVVDLERFGGLLQAFSSGTQRAAVAVAEGVDRAALRDHVLLGSRRIGTAVPVALRFRGRGAVAGQVLAADGTTPIQDVAVNLFPDPGSRERGRGIFSDAQGRFGFQGVPLGAYTIEATTGSRLHRTVSGSLDAVAEVDEVTVVLSQAAVPRGELRGRVLENDGSAHGGARVAICAAGSEDGCSGVVAIVDADGTGAFAARDVPVGSWDVFAVSADGRRRGSAEAVAVVEGAATWADVRLQGRTQLVVEVLFANGDRVAGALVSGGETIVVTGADGRAVLDGVPTGSRQIAALVKGDPTHADPRRRFTRTTGDSVHVVPGAEGFATLRFGAVGSLFGQVRDAAGRPVPHVQVAAPVGDEGFFYTKADGEGRFRFDGLQVGDWTLSAPAPVTADTDVSGILETLGGEPGEDELLAAIGEAFAIFAGVNDPLLNPVPFNPLTWGYTEVALDTDGASREANITYLTPGTVRGVVRNGQGVPIGARVRLTGVGPTSNGDVGFIVRGERNSDPALGTFDFEGQALEGSFGLQAASPFFPTVATANGVITDVQPEPPPVTLQFPPVAESNGRITGTVLAPDGSPAPGADVYVHFGAGCSAADRDACVRRVTDPSGRFGHESQLFDLPAFGSDGPRSYFVEAIDTLGTGLVASGVAKLSPGQTTDVTLRLIDRGGLSILVRQSDGTPAPGAQVGITGRSHPNESFSGTTDASGQLRFGDATLASFPLFEGSYTVEATWVSGAASIRGRASAVVPPRAIGTATVTLGPTADLHGFFFATDRATPVAFAQVAVGSLGFATTDAQGAFAVEGLPLGTYDVVGRDAVTGRAARRTVKLERAGEDHEVILVASATGELTGVVIDSFGSGTVPAATVELRSLDGLSPLRTATTDPAGFFSFPAVPAGPFRLEAEHPLLRTRGTVEASFPDGAASHRADVRLAPRARLTVRVLEPDGATPAAADVTLVQNHAMGSGPTAQTDPEGRVVFDQVSLGTFDLRAFARPPGPTRSTAEGVVSVTRPGVLPGEVVLRLSGTGSVMGRVYESDGVTPATLATVELLFEAPLFRNTTASPDVLADGAFLFGNLPLGPFRLVARDGALGASASGVVTANQEMLALDLVIGESGSVAGRVVDPGGAPVAGTELVLRYQPQVAVAGTALATADADGRFRFDDVPVGEVSLLATASAIGGVRSAPRGDEPALLLEPGVLDLGDLVLDVEPPAVAGVDPPHTATGVPTDTAIVLTFSEPLLRTAHPGGLDPSGVYLQRGAERIAADVLLDPNDPARVMLTPQAPLASETVYDVIAVSGILQNAVGAIIARGPTDLEERPLVLSFVSRFTTRDDDPPGLLSLSPVDGAEQVDPSAVVRLSFDEPLDPASVAVSLADEGGLPVPGSLAVGVDGRVVVFTPAAFLAPNRVYTATVSGVSDLAGNPAEGLPLVARFATVDTLGPAIAALGIAGGAAPIAGTTVGIEAALAAPEPGASVRMSVDFTAFGASLPGVLSLPLVLPPAGRVVVRAIAIDRHGNEGPVAELPIDVVPNQPPQVTLSRVAPADGPVPSGSTLVVEVSASDDAGVAELRAVASGAGSFPLTVTGGAPIQVSVPVPASAGAGAAVTLRAEAIDTSGASSGEQALVVPVADGVAPAVAIASPAPGTTVDAGAGFEVVVDASDAFGVASIELAAAGPVAGGGVQDFDPATAAAQAVFPLTVAADAPGLAAITLTATARDASGRTSSTGPVVLSVRDVVPPSVVSVSPVDGASDVPIATAVVLAFSEALDPASVTAASVRLESGGAPVAASLALGAGNTTATLVPSQPLAYAASYAVRVETAVRDVAGNPLAAPFASGFTTAADVLGPRLLELVPADGAGDVSIAPLLRARFDEAVAPGSLAPGGFELRDLDGGDVPVAAELASENGDRDLVLRPGSPLEFDRAYALVLQPGLLGADGNPVRGTDGAPLAAPLVHAFRTSLFGITTPRDGTTVDEGSTLLLEAQASPGLGVDRVRFEVNGVVASVAAAPPFRASTVVPSADEAPELVIRAIGLDSAGQVAGSDTVRVGVGRSLRLAPRILGVPVGESRELRVVLSSPAPADLPVSLAFAEAGVAEAPAVVVVPAGALEAAIDVEGIANGSTALAATSTRGSAGAAVSVGTPVGGEVLELFDRVGAPVQPAPEAGQLLLATPSARMVSVAILDAPAPADTAVLVSSSNPAVADVTGSVVVPAGSQTAALEIEAGAAGVALLVLRAGGEVRQLTVIVGAPPVAVYEPVYDLVGAVVQRTAEAGQILVPGAGIRTLSIPILAAPAPAVLPVSVVTSNAGVARVDAPAMVPAGGQMATVDLVTEGDGVALLTLSAGGVSRAVTVVVGPPPPGLHAPLFDLVGAPVLRAAHQVWLDPGASRTLAVLLLPYPALFPASGSAESRDPTVASVTPASFSFGVGEPQAATLTLTAGDAPGVTLVDVRYGEVRLAIEVVVGTPGGVEIPDTRTPVTGVRVEP
jgi:hypothetical protein